VVKNEELIILNAKTVSKTGHPQVISSSAPTVNNTSGMIYIMH
jgi:hypothetical protein